MEVWRHDYTTDTGKTAVEITLNGVSRTLLFAEHAEATAVTDLLVELFELKRSSSVWYMFSTDGL